MASQTYEIEFDGYWRDPNKSNITSSAGIYCVYSCIHNKMEKTVSLKKLIYIGQSADLNDRLSNHEKLDDWKKHVKTGEVLSTYAKVIKDFSSQNPCHSVALALRTFA